MQVFRISIEKYAKKLTASGAANRWNQAGEFVIYAAQSRSLATLELVVHSVSIKPNLKYKVMLIELAIKKSQIEKIDVSKLPKRWRSISAYPQPQHLGSDWYSKKEQLVLEIPSTIIPKESNFIISTKHPIYASHVKLIDTEAYFWDERLLH